MNKIANYVSFWERPQISFFTCDCSRIGTYEWIEADKEKECPYCGNMTQVEVIHEEIKQDEGSGA